MSGRGVPPPWVRLALPFPDAIPIDLARTLGGGQSFRWRNVCGGRSWLGVASGNVIELRWSGEDEVSRHPTTRSGRRSGSDLMFRFWHCNAPQRTVQDQSAFLIRYLSLDKDANRCWAAWTQRYPEHPLVVRLQQAVGVMGAKKSGAEVVVPHQMLRVLQQELHETIFAFICSQNNNLKRITGLVETLASKFGDPLISLFEDASTRELLRAAEVPDRVGPVAGAGSKKRARSTAGDSEVARAIATMHTLHAFPTIDQLSKATDEQLRSSGFGYRSTFVIKSVDQILSHDRARPENPENNCSGRRPKGDAVESPGTPTFYRRLIESARRGDTDDARVALMSLHGVGRKVADCILLFALGDRTVVPIDTHMAQISLECVLRTKKDLFALRKVGNPSNTADAGCGDGGKDVEEVLNSLLALQAKQQLCAKAEKALSLTPAHHGTLQWAYRRVFGDECGWAHSVLFSSKMLDG